MAAHSGRHPSLWHTLWGHPWLGKVQIAAYLVVGVALVASLFALYSQDQRDREGQPNTSTLATSTPSVPPTQATGGNGLPRIQATINDDAIGSDQWQVQYMGQWRYQEGSAGFYQGDQHEAGSADASAQVQFSGSAVQVFGSRGPEGGQAEVLIDGRSVGSIDFAAEQVQTNQVVFSSSLMKEGAHTLVVRVTRTGAGSQEDPQEQDSGDFWWMRDQRDQQGVGVSLDRFVVTTTTPPPLDPMQPGGGSPTSGPWSPETSLLPTLPSENQPTSTRGRGHGHGKPKPDRG